MQLSKDQIEKIGNTVIYFGNNVGELSKTKLLKLLFLTEEASIKTSGIPFFGLDFKLWQYGPVVEPIYNEIHEGNLKVFAPYFDVDAYGYFKGKKEFNDDEFSDNDIALLNRMVDFARNKIARDFVNITHEKGSLWDKGAIKHGILNELNRGDITRTNYSIEFDMLFEDKNDFLFEKYQDALENKAFSNLFK